MSFDSKIHRPAYWWVEIEGIRKRFGHHLPSWNPDLDLEADWWQFLTAPSNDCLEAQGDYSDDFDPSGDFSVLMMVEMQNYGLTDQHGLMGKCNIGLYQPGGWEVSFFGPSAGSNPGKIDFIVCKSGGTSYTEIVSGGAAMAVGRKVLIACMYEYVGDGTSVMRIVTYDAVNGKLSAQTSAAVGPTGNNPNEMRIGRDLRHSYCSDCKVYWAGLYDGTFLSDDNIAGVWAETVDPINDLDPTVLCYFDQEVGATYLAEVSGGPNGPYTFDVIGAPTAGP